MAKCCVLKCLSTFTLSWIWGGVHTKWLTKNVVHTFTWWQQANPMLQGPLYPLIIVSGINLVWQMEPNFSVFGNWSNTSYSPDGSPYNISATRVWTCLWVNASYIPYMVSPKIPTHPLHKINQFTNHQEFRALSPATITCRQDIITIHHLSPPPPPSYKYASFTTHHELNQLFNYHQNWSVNSSRFSK